MSVVTESAIDMPLSLNPEERQTRKYLSKKKTPLQGLKTQEDRPDEAESI